MTVPSTAPGLQEAEQAAFNQAGQGLLTVIELFSAAQRLGEAGQAARAAQLYRAWLAHTPSPVAYAAQFNLAVLLIALGDDAGAEAAYRAALAQAPAFLEGLLNLGTLLERTGRPLEALDCWRTALAGADLAAAGDKALYIQALNNLGRLLELRKELPEAEEMLTRSLREDPAQASVMTHWVHLRQKQCKWPVYDGSLGFDVASMVTGTSALAMLSASGDPELQLLAARRFVKEKVVAGVAALASQDGYRHARLRIGYLSSDFCSHAVSILTAELYELHDRGQVEVYGFCWSNEDGSPIRARVVKAMDHYVRIAGIGDEAAARCIRDHEIDILVDLHGLTLGARPNILAYRPAPVQITWLGLPGPTALPGVDYVLVDEFLFPPELAPYFTEQPLYLPNCFQINDRQRAIGPRSTRAANGLPDDAFVFCAFNNHFKFTPEVFDCWMRILLRAPHGVLWLVVEGDDVRETLCRRAEQQGVARTRLYFAARVAPADYLARYQLADLFVDTLPFNGGTTASDALWAGLPVLTCAGRTFASRMAGSLLLAVDLPELITHSLNDYENLAVSLAHAPERVAAMKRQLEQNRLSCRLFDSPQLVRDLEALFQRIARRPGGGARESRGALVGKARLGQFDALEAGVIFTAWTGAGALPAPQAEALLALLRHSGRPVVLVDAAGAAEWEVPQAPFHPAYALLDQAHQADYLRAYLLHHFGGGYSALAPAPAAVSWTGHFERFGAGEPPAVVEPDAGQDGRERLIARRHSPFTAAWLAGVEGRLDEQLEALRRHAADPLHAPYPLAPNSLGGAAFAAALASLAHQPTRGLPCQ
ncbi:putative O-linked N-acetylglucosamine transferase (SPINDLY family) [Janthinobacterium sp. CG_23.3]|uniref:O-linked N-acetylglucosamine transferase, SPINDLY family protein n=1 Tax=Janthinobacterium sp. CG_23.3 TaxID=3349634 RepID=UPI0038D4BBD9